MTPCFLCNQEVLEFPGEFDFFDTYPLTSDTFEDELALEEEAFGAVHAKCLKTSDWGKFWAGKRRQHYQQNLGMKPFAIHEGQEYYYHPRSKDFYLLQPHGHLLTFTLQEWQTSKRQNGQRTIEIKQDYHQELASDQTSKIAASKLLQRSSCTLLEFAKILNLEDTLQSPKIAQKGTLRFLSSTKTQVIPLEIRARLTAYLELTHNQTTTIEHFLKS